MLTLNRALFDLVENKMHVVEKERRLRVFQYHLIQRTAGKRFRSNLHPNELTFDKNGDWKDIGQVAINICCLKSGR